MRDQLKGARRVIEAEEYRIEGADETVAELKQLMLMHIDDLLAQYAQADQLRPEIGAWAQATHN